MTQVVHGTYHESWINIKRTGLSKMGRTHIHFAKGEYGSADVISGTLTFARHTRRTSDWLMHGCVDDQECARLARCSSTSTSPWRSKVIHGSLLSRLVLATNVPARPST